MLITCPTCEAVYRVDDGAIGPNGRNVQCDACGAQWRQAPAEPRPSDEELYEEIEEIEAEEAAEAQAAEVRRRKTPGLEEAAELLHEMREESARTDSISIFGDDLAAKTKKPPTRDPDRDDLVTEAEIRRTIASANRSSPKAEKPERGGGFKVGFVIALMFVGVLAFAYLANGLLAEQFPAAASVLGAYADVVDGVRGLVEKTAAGAMQ